MKPCYLAAAAAPAGNGGDFDLKGVLILAVSSGTYSEKLYDEAYRPQYHYSPPHSWTNDPSGLVYYEGEYHLFFQFHPGALVWGPMHWGHAVSKDMIHWETLPIAMYPDDNGTIFTGCVVVDAENTSGLVPGGGLVAVFTFHPQTQGIAYSQDAGRTWTKYAGNPVLPALHKDFRDPKVIWYGDHWVAAFTTGSSILFMQSPDLIHWEQVGEFTSGYPGLWEVPDLFPVEIGGVTKWVLLVSINGTAPAGGSGTCYFIGSFDGRTFTDENPDQLLWLDWGADNYAGTTYANVEAGRHLFIGWMNNWAYANRIPTSVWRGAMTIPRELGLAQTPEGIRLVQRPVAALNVLRMPLGSWEDRAVAGELALDALEGQLLDIECEFEAEDARRFGLDLFVTSESRVRIAYDTEAQRLLFQRPEAGIADFNPEFSAALAPVEGRIRLRVLVDRSSVEVFANDGLLALTGQIFTEPEAKQVRLFAENGTAILRSLSAYALRSIWA